MLVAAAATVLLAFMAWRLIDSHRVHEGGPLAEPKAFGSAALRGGLDPGEPLSVGQYILENTGSGPVRVDRLWLVEPTPGLRLVGAYASHESHVGARRGYGPPRSASHPVGLEVPPGRDAAYVVVIGVQADKPGRYVTDGLRVAYHRGGRRWETTLRQSIVLCVPESTYPCDR